MLQREKSDVQHWDLIHLCGSKRETNRDPVEKSRRISVGGKMHFYFNSHKLELALCLCWMCTDRTAGQLSTVQSKVTAGS